MTKRQRVTIAGCNRDRRQCVICWYGPECGPFYGIQRVTIDTERPCPCECHAAARQQEE